MNSKNILLLVTHDHGGAGEYMYKLSKLLQSQKNNVILFVKEKTKKDDFIIEIIKQKKSPFRFFTKLNNSIKKKLIKYKLVEELKLDEKYCFYSIDELSNNINAKNIILQIGFNPDFIFSGWTADFLNSTEIYQLQKRTNAKLYNITIDMNQFTGGCHYAWNCKGYLNECSNCPAILSKSHKNLASKNFNQKLENAKGGNFKIIAGSGWTLNQSKISKIYKYQNVFYNINSLIDTNVMKLSDKDFAKKEFDMKLDKFYILMGCQNGKDERKGYKYLIESLSVLYNNLNKAEREKIIVLIISKSKLDIDEIKFDKKHLNYIIDYNQLALLYQSADVFVNSSVEDSGPMMVSEALACGTPVVGFDMGVVNNMVFNGVNGYKAKLMDTEDLAKGIKTIFELSNIDYKKYSDNAINQIKKYSSIEYGIEVLNKILSE